ncbi:sugar transferase [Aeromicrobium wangtongii]|uniref:sugar transferase n=1 Tax=Aeromicrobium wangtongii TaxID=2969247 RepID=UPI002017BD30|nr:sugar transferase [Aeromicrobium wangtongii]MCL3817242.1 sugar transferase [Aeromicrobium wangtongii]
MTDLARDITSDPELDSDGYGLPPVTSSQVLVRRNRQTNYRRGLLVTDLAVLAAAVSIAQLWHFGTDSDVRANGPFDVSYTGLGAAVVALWWAVLELIRARDTRVIGDGTDEYRRVARATFATFGSIAIVSLMFKWDMSRGYLAIAFPLGLFGLIAGRKVWRVWVHRQRRQGHHLSSVLVVGGPRSASDMAAWFHRHPSAGLRVAGVWVPDAQAEDDESLDVLDQQIPVMGNDQNLFDALSIAEADTVIVTDTEHLGHRGLRDLTWQLEGVDVDLMVSPNVTDFSGSRIHVRAVAGMPLMHLEEPQYAEAGAWPKLVFDRVFALLAIVAFAPLLIIAASAVKLTSTGPLLYRQRRVGLHGEAFDMLKFRSMRVGADAELADLIEAQGTADIPLFKVKDDPRITKVGAVLRRYSIDELPQLFNVLRGDMSVVGPRPQVAAEVELYDDRAFRRLTVRPGMTGLWQVSGRSDLSWEDSIRLDTYYVENWSLTSDLAILWRTIRAVVVPDGAY